jgi:tetratricopeptide (TPR) repeat protein
MGFLRRTQGRLAESQVELETAIALDRNNASALLLMGTTLQAQGKPEAAIPYYEKSIRLDPRALNVCHAYVNLANCRLFLDRVEEAIGAYRRARALGPGVWFVHLGLAGALGLSGDIDEAKIEIAEMLKLKPEMNSIARWRAILTTMGFGHPQYWALRDKTTFAGLRRAGFPEE